MIRFYGSDLTGEGNNHKPMSEEVEAQIMRKLSISGLYPDILSVFPGGRIEKFVSGRQVTIHEINELKLNLIIMRKLAAIHSMSDMPCGREPMFTFDTFRKYLTALEAAGHEPVIVDDTDRDAYEMIRSFDFRSESQWLEQVFTKIDSRSVFCHNDLHKNNIMINKGDEGAGNDDNNNHLISRNTDEELLIIDYEYASMNYRWSDLSIHLIELSLSSYDHEMDKLLIQPKDEEFVRTVVSCYLGEWLSINKVDDDPGHGMTGTCSNNIDTMDHLMYEISFGQMIIHYARVLFFAAYVRRNYGPMQSWKYTRMRLNQYFSAKRDFVNKYMKQQK